LNPTLKNYYSKQTAMKSTFGLFVLQSAILAVHSSHPTNQRLLVSCPNGGIFDSTSKFCCPNSCGECGGYGCDARPGGAGQCCTSQITESCDESSLPCIASSTTSACPTGGIANSSGKVCCPESCGECGGYGCHLRPGGAAKCCTGSVTNLCSESDLPCVADGGNSTESPPSASSTTPEPTPQEENGVCEDGGILATFRYVGSCEINVCCPKTCPSCDASFECSLEPECCAQNIARNVHLTDKDVSCNDNAPPCVVPPLENPCEPNPCEQGVSCSVAFDFTAYMPEYCEYKYSCNCSEAGSYVSSTCEKKCNDDQMPCGATRSNHWGRFSSYSDNECCESWEECVEFSYASESPYYGTFCIEKDRPESCDPNPCQNDGFCYEEYGKVPSFYSCSCSSSWQGTICDIPVES